MMRFTKELYFITSTVIDWMDIFTRPKYKHIIIDSLVYCKQEKGLEIYGWVLMTNHLHLIVATNGEYRVPDILRDFKKFTAKRILAELETDLMESRRDWLLRRFKYAAANDKKTKNGKIWQEGNHIEQIYTKDFFEQKLNYIHMNPVRAEFVSRPEDFLYSSAIDYAGGKGLIEITFI
ncbi:MAG: transposase [Prevotella sp.]|nr:transposase [Prevotella sp.]